MPTFKQFLEGATGELPKYSPVEDIDAALDIINSHCKDAIPMLKSGDVIYRGDHKSIKRSFATVDTSATERSSANITNHYTVLLNNNPRMKGYPKRSASFICTSDESTARSYSGGKEPYVIVPYDGVPIGVCPGSDMWYTPVFLAKREFTIDEVADVLNDMGIDDNIADIDDFGERLANGDEVAVQAVEDSKLAKLTSKERKDFVETLMKALDPKKMGMKLATTKTIGPLLKQWEREVWVGGKVLVMTLPAFYKVQRRLNGLKQR